MSDVCATIQTIIWLTECRQLSLPVLISIRIIIINIAMFIIITIVVITGVCEQSTPFTQAFALQSSSRNCNPALDLALWKLVLPVLGCVFLQRSVLFTDTGIKSSALAARKGRGRVPWPITIIIISSSSSSSTITIIIIIIKVAAECLDLTPGLRESPRTT